MIQIVGRASGEGRKVSDDQGRRGPIVRVETTLRDSTDVDGCELEDARGHVVVFGGRPATARMVRSWAECILAAVSAMDPVALIASGPRLLHSAIAYSRDLSRLLLVSGRGGLFPIYLLESRSDLWFSTHPGLLLGKVRMEPDPAGLAQLLYFGHCLGRTTATRNLRVLEPARVVRWQAGAGVSWLGRYAEAARDRQRAPKANDLSSEIRQRLDDVVSNSLDAGDGWLQCSGGLDSRLLLAAARNAPAELMTFGSPGSTDVTIARDLAAVTGRRLHEFDTGIPEAALDGWADRVVWCSGGEKPLDNAHTALPYEAYAQAGPRVLVNGNGGEYARAYWYDLGALGHLFSASIPSGLNNRMVAAYLERRMAGSEGASLIRLLRPEVIHGLDPTPQAALSCSLQGFQGRQSLASLLDDHYLDERNHRFIMLGLQLGGMFFKRAHPFFDPALQDLMSRIPVGDRLGSKFHRETITAMVPSLGQVTWDKTGRPLAEGVRAFAWIPHPLARKQPRGLRNGALCSLRRALPHQLAQLVWRHCQPGCRSTRQLDSFGGHHEVERRTPFWGAEPCPGVGSSSDVRNVGRPTRCSAGARRTRAGRSGSPVIPGKRRHIFVIGNRNWNTLSRMVGAERAGWDVSWSVPFWGSGLLLWRRYLQYRWRTGPDVDRYNRALLAGATSAKPGIVWVEEPIFTYASTLREIQERTGATLVCVYSDDPRDPAKKSRHHDEAVTTYDVVFATKDDLLQRYFDAGCRGPAKFWKGFDPERIHPVALTDEDTREYGSDTTFVGHADFVGGRPARLTPLLAVAREIPGTKIWGRSWAKVSWPKDLTSVVHPYQIDGLDYTKAICAAKVAIQLPSRLARDTHSSRSVEIPACRTFMLAERTVDHQTLFEEDKEAVFFGSIAELVEKAKYLRGPRCRERAHRHGWLPKMPEIRLFKLRAHQADAQGSRAYSEISSLTL